MKKRSVLLVLCWFCLNGLFAQVNDEPCNAILLPNPTEACRFYETTNVGFTPSVLPTLPSSGTPVGGNCNWSATASLDAWFTVVVPVNGKIDVSIDKTSGLVTHIFAVYRKNTTCSSLTAITGKPGGPNGGTIGLRTCVEYGTAGSTPPFNMYTGLTPGDTVYIRVWNKSSASPGPFGICVSTPINDDCSNPTYLCDLNGYTGITSTSYTEDLPGNIKEQDPIFFNNTIENNAWFAFVARSTSITIHLDNYCEGSGQAMQMAIYDATNCTGFTLKGVGFTETRVGVVLTAERLCQVNCDYTATGLIPGKTYYLMTDGASNALCHYTLSVKSSEIFTVDAGADTNICLGSPITLNAFSPGTGSSFSWKQRVGGVLSDLGTGATQTINPGPTQTTTYILEVTGGSLCSGVVDSMVVSVSDCSTCPTVATNDTNYCSAGLVQIVATPSVAANYVYQWTVPAGATNPGNVSSFTTNVAGDYIVKLTSTNYLCNTDFEDKLINTLSGYSGGTVQTSEANVPCWKTTATDGKLEVWNNTNTWCSPECNAYSGIQFAELNATQAANLYQDFSVMPGSSTAISFAHRGRSGTDVMEVKIGPTAGPYVSLGQFSDGNTAWGYHSVDYTFPNNGVTNYRILFVPVSSSGGLSFGNFLDAISINLNTCSQPTDTATVVKSCACPTAAITYNGSPWCTTATTQSVTLTGTGTYTGGKYSASPAGLAIDSISGLITPATSSAGNYTVTYTIAASGVCASTVTATTNVAITKAPTASISYSSNVFCTSLATAQPVTLTGTDAYTSGAYTASPSGLTMNASGGITPSTSTPASYVVTYTYPAFGGCPSGTDTTHVTIAALSTVAISYTASPYCSSLTSLQPVTLVGSSGGTYSSTAGLTLNTNTGEITPSSSIAGTSYVVTYSVGATGGCPAVSDTANVFIAEAPSATISYASSPYCSTLTTAQAVTFAGTTGGTYSVLPSGLTINASGGITPSTSTAGTYVVTYTTPASGGCAAVSDTANVTITTAPTATISYAASPYCTSLNTPQAITFTGTTGGTYSSLPTGLSMNAAGAITPSISTAGAYVVTYTIAASAGCAAVSDTANVTITAAPTAKISYSSAIFCTALATAQPVTLTGTNAYTGGSYSSLPSGLSMDGAGAITPSTSTPQLYTITYSYPALGGCAAGTADTTVTIAAIPTADIIYSGSPYCTTLTSPQTVTFTGTSGGSYSTTGGLTLNATDGSITPSTSTAGTYVVTYAILAGGGCPAVSDTANVTINGKPTLTISGVNSICTGESTTLKASGATSYVWDNTLTTDSITVAPIQNTTYKVTGTALGCSDTASYAVAIKPLPTLSIQGAELLCIGDSTLLTASGADSYLWSPQVSLSSTTQSIVSAFPATPTTYTLVGTLNGCMDSITHTISVYALPIISLSNSTSGCEPLRVDFTASSTPQLQSISWNFGNGSTSTSTSPNALYLNDGVYDVSANVTDVNGCKSDTTEVGFVTVYPKPVIDFSYMPREGVVNEPVTFTSSYTQTPATWIWVFGDGNSQSNIVSEVDYTYRTSKTFVITHIVQTDQGCKDTAYRRMVILAHITIPNVLTPNGDGFNDTFIIDGLQFVEGAKMKIYNRWGRKVYESDSYQNDWDGGNCSEGVYYYVLTLPDFLKLGPYSGSVTLFRN